jgi:hypothetical protein
LVFVFENIWNQIKGEPFHTKQTYMKRIAEVLLVGILLATVHQVEVDAKRTAPPPSTQGQPCLKLMALSSTLTFTKDGEPIEVQSYSASDGAMVFASHFYYRSSKKAIREMNRELRTAVEIIRRETLLDENGQKIGAKVVGRFKSRSPGREFQVLWTDRSNFKLFSGPSLEHLYQLLKPGCK